jgi:hypothetical protein
MARGTEERTNKLLLALGSVVIQSSGAHETDDHILVCDGSGSLRASVTSQKLRIK